MTDFKEGDKVRVVFEGVVNDRFITYGGFQLMAIQCPLVDRAKSIELIERAGRPLEVGETVIIAPFDYEGVVRYVKRDRACVDVDNCLEAVYISLLRRPCGTPITESK